jgi:hypothetical protein
MSYGKSVWTLIASTTVIAAITPRAHAIVVDLVNNQTSSAAGAIFYRADFQSAGTGFIDPFVRLQHDNGPSNNNHSPKGEQQGYNTSGRPVQYDELTDLNYTRNLTFSDVPTVFIGSVPYKQFLLDINEPNGGGQNLLSLDMVNIYTSTTGSQTGLESSLGVLRWSLGAFLDDNVVTLDYDLNSGSGQGDMQMYVPLSNFAGVAGSDFLYLYSYFGHYMPSDFQTGDGFEEWTVLIPAPASLAVFGLGALLTARRRR